MTEYQRIRQQYNDRFYNLAFRISHYRPDLELQTIIDGILATAGRTPLSPLQAATWIADLAAARRPLPFEQEPER